MVRLRLPPYRFRLYSLRYTDIKCLINGYAVLHYPIKVWPCGAFDEKKNKCRLERTMYTFQHQLMLQIYEISAIYYQ